MKQHTTETRNNRMEDLIHHSRTVCDRCGKKRPDGSNGLGWFEGRLKSNGQWDWYGFDYDAKLVDICPDCFKSSEESGKAQQQVLQYIHFSLFRRSRNLKVINDRYLSDQTGFLDDCENVSKLLNQYRRYRKQKFYRIYYAGKAVRLNKEMFGFLKRNGKPISEDGLKYVIENDDGSILFMDEKDRKIFVAKSKSDFLALYWYARTTAKMNSHNPRRSNLKPFPNENTANNWKDVARYARRKIKELSHQGRVPAGRPNMFTRIPAEITLTEVSS